MAISIFDIRQFTTRLAKVISAAIVAGNGCAAIGTELGPLRSRTLEISSDNGGMFTIEEIEVVLETEMATMMATLEKDPDNGHLDVEECLVYKIKNGDDQGHTLRLQIVGTERLSISIFDY